MGSDRISQPVAGGAEPRRWLDAECLLKPDARSAIDRHAAATLPSFHRSNGWFAIATVAQLLLETERSLESFHVFALHPLLEGAFGLGADAPHTEREPRLSIDRTGHR